MRCMHKHMVCSVIGTIGLLIGNHRVIAQEPAEPTSQAPWYQSVKQIPAGPGKLDVGLNLRARYEYTDNFNVRRYGTEASDDLLLLRTWLTFNYSTEDFGRLFLHLQDARFYASDLDRRDFPGTSPHYDALDIRQAFYEWRNIGDTPFGFKLGRQSISYGDRRVFGPGNWGNVGSYWWDAAVAYIHTRPVNVDLLYGRRVISEQTSFNDRHFDFDMYAAYAQFKEWESDPIKLKLDLFYVLKYDDSGNTEGKSGIGNEEIHSVGFHVKGACGNALDYSGTAVQQFGSYGKDDVRASYYHAGIGYTLEIPWKPRIGADYVYASGESDDSDARRRSYNDIFSDLATYYGRMNLFRCRNLESYVFSLRGTPRKGIRLIADYHIFRLAEATDVWPGRSGPPRRDPTGEAGKNLGQEIDLSARWQVDRNWQLMTGWSRFFPGSYLDRTEGNADAANWFFTQVTYQF